MRRLIATLLACLSFALARVGASAGSDPTVVVITPPRGVLADPISLVTATSAQLADLPVRLLIESAAENNDAERAAATAARHHATAVFWFDTEGGQLVIYAYDAETGHAQMRRLNEMSESTAVEEASVIIRETMAARLEGGPMRLGDELPPPAPPVPAPPPPPPPPPLPPPRPPRSPKVELTGAYAGMRFSPGVGINGISLGGRVRVTPALDAGAFAAYFLPATRNGGDVAMSVQRSSLGAEIGARFAWTALWGRTAVGLFADRIGRSSSAFSADFVATEDDARLTYGPHLALEIGAPLGRRVSVFARGTLEIAARTWTYEIADTGDPFMAPQRLRYGGGVGALVGLDGGP
jgi:hypothetical protein